VGIIIVATCFVISVTATKLYTYYNSGDDKSDAAAASQLNFQTPATTIMEKIVDLHHDLMFFIIVVVVFVS
jgi:heme/copper-type cytochrome/quinol oxidase subunit 2